jgi:heterodisulfide reductase subunit C
MTVAENRTGLIDEILEVGSKIFPREELEKLQTCIQCGKCVGGCPSGRIVSWNIRKIFREIQMGLREKVISDENLWLCTTCYTCQERCPRGVQTTDIVRIIRNIAVKEGYMKNGHMKVCDSFFRTGHAVPLSDEASKIRKDLGLTVTPPTVLSCPEGFKEILTLIDATGFKKIVSVRNEK